MDFLAPLTFETPAEAARFAHFNVCSLCRAALVPDGLAVNCPHCGPPYRHNVTSRHTIERIEDREAATRIELGSESGKTPAEILTELGY